MRDAPDPTGRSDTDDELFDRAKGGDRTAFATLYLRHRDTARRVAGRISHSAADADDAVAEAFTRVLAALPRLTGRQISFRAYLLTTVRNILVDRHRRMARVELPENLPEVEPAPEADAAVLVALDHHLVRQALRTLPLRWRTVLWLTTVEGLGPAEVGRRLGVKPSAVSAVAYRSRIGLRLAYAELADGDAAPPPAGRRTVAAA